MRLYRWKRRRSLRSIRRSLQSFGVNVDHLSDEQLEATLWRLSRSMHNASMAVQEFGRRLNRALQLSREFEEREHQARHHTTPSDRLR